MGLYLVFAVSDSSWLAWTLNVVLVLVGLNLVILVHELGHFVVARMCGVRCEKFYVWFDIFGWKLLKFRRGDTEYGLGVLPLGGYVKMLGQEDNPARLKEEIQRAKLEHPQPSAALKRDIESAEQALYDPQSYLAQSVPKRMAIISAGVVMNVVFSFVAAVFAYGLGVQQIECAVGAVFAGEAAWRANLRVGDRIERIADTRAERFSDLQRAVSVGDIDDGVTMVLRRPNPDGSQQWLELTLHPDRFRDAPTIGISNGYCTRLGEQTPVLPGSSAASAQPGFRGGDRVVRVDDVPIRSYAQIHSLLALHPQKPLSVTVERMIPEEESPSDAPTATRQITIQVAPQPMRRLGLVMQMGPITAIQDDSPAARAGIRPGDRIRLVDGRHCDPITLPNQIRRLAQEKEKITLTIQRPGKTEPVDVEVSLREADWYATPIETTSPTTIPHLGIAYRVLNRVREIEEDSPASAAGLQAGVVVVQAKLIRPDEATLAGHGVDPKNIDLQREELAVKLDQAKAGWTIVPWLLQGSLPGTRVELELEDGRTVLLTPVESSDWFHVERGLAFQPLAFTQTAQSVPEAIALGLQETWDSLTLIYRTLASLGTGQVSFKGLAGPVGIARIAFEYASRGLSSLLIFLCLISANLAVINFIPIPVLDGGHMVFLTYEGIRGKPPSEGVLTTLTFGGLVLLLTLMIWVTGWDIFKWIWLGF